MLSLSPALLPELAEAGFIAAGKDISNAGLCGTLLMLLESSACGANLDLARVPAPPCVDPARWLSAFPSFGFLLTVEPRHATAVCARFEGLGIASAVVGELTSGAALYLSFEEELSLFRDLGEAPLTGFGACA